MLRPLSIAFVIDTAAAARSGGLVSGQRVIAALRENHTVTVIGIGGDVPLPELRLPLFHPLVEQNQFMFARPDDEALGEALSRADVVHIQLPFFLGFGAMRHAERLGVPVVAAHHVQPENALRNVGLRAPRVARWVNRTLVRRFYQRANVVLCPTAFSRDELTAAGLTVPTVVISNGVPEWFTPSDAPRNPDTPFTLLTVGRMSPEKRQDVVLEAVHRARHRDQFRVVLAGKGPREAALRKRAETLGLNVELGFVPDQRLLALYQTADLYVHASEVELEGMSVLEAMRCGCPALVADSPSSAARELALDPLHTFPAGDVRALAERLDYWFEHRAELEQARRRTLEATANRGLRETVRALESLYYSVAGASPRGVEAGAGLGVPAP